MESTSMTFNAHMMRTAVLASSKKREKKSHEQSDGKRPNE
jgi:hypothetical protein